MRTITYGIEEISVADAHGEDYAAEHGIDPTTPACFVVHQKICTHTVTGDEYESFPVTSRPDRESAQRWIRDELEAHEGHHEGQSVEQ